MRSWHVVLVRCATVLAFVSVVDSAWPAPARLRLEGWPLASREGEALFANALRVPGDSVALASALGRGVARLQSGGWHDAALEGTWDASRGTLAVQVASGPRRRWGALAFDVPSADTAFVQRAVQWPEGEPADPALLARTVDALLARAQRAGHAWAQLAVTEWRADDAHVAVRLSGALGPRVLVDAVRLDGLVTTRRDVADRALGRLAGLPYNPEASRDAAARLATLGVFARVGAPTLEAGPQWEHATLVIPVSEPRYNRFEGALGLQGAAGLVGLASLDLGNLLGTARSASLAWQSRGGGRTDLRMRYVEPFVAGLPYRVELRLVQQMQDSTYTRTRWGVRLGHGLGADDRIELGHEEERVVQTRGAVQQAALQNTSFTYERDGRDDRLSPRRGVRARVSGAGVFKRETRRASVAGPAGTRRSRAGTAELVLEMHRPLQARTGLAWELAAQGRFAGSTVLEPWERTPVGGARTLRGHDEEEFLVDRAVVSRLEARAFPGTIGEHIALFWDHAEMFTREPEPTGPRVRRRSADGLGLGLHLVTGAGRVDVDYGVAPGRGALDGRIHLRLVSTF